MPRKARPHRPSKLTSLLLTPALGLLSTHVVAQEAAPAPAPPAAEKAAPAEPAPAAKPAEGTTPAASGTEGLSAEEAKAVEEALAAEAKLTSDDINPDDIVDLTVTVDRRGKRLQKYGGSASAYTQQDLDRLGISNLQNLSAISPGVEIGVQEGNVEVFIRGIGNDNNTELGDPAAATHFDGVYIPRPRGVGAMFFDLERVEVNRGPQGTVRGRNATAGSLNLVSAKPKFSIFEAGAETQLGTYNQKMLKAMVNAGLTDNFGLRLATYAQTRDSYYHNAYGTPGFKPPGAVDELAYRASAKWKPSDLFTWTFIHDYSQDKGTGNAGSSVGRSMNRGNKPEDLDLRNVWYRGAQPWLKQKHWGLSTNLLFDFGPVLFEAIGAYRNFGYKQGTGGNYGVAHDNPNPTLNWNRDNYTQSYWSTTSKSYIGELRLFAPDTARFRWSLGGFAFHEDQTAILAGINDNSTGNIGGDFIMPDVKGTSLAGYADGTFDITKRWRALAGFRYTQEKKSRNGYSLNWNFDFGGVPQKLGTDGFRFAPEKRTIFTTNGAPGAAFLDGVASLGNRDTLQQALLDGAVDKSTITVQKGSVSSNFMDFRVGTEFDVTPNTFTFFTVSTGHKSGGFNDTLTFPNGDTIVPTYKPETLISYEGGVKNEFFKKKLRLNATGFWYDYRDQTFQTIVTYQDPSGTSDDLAAATRFNAGRSRVVGGELESFAYLPWGFQAGAQLLVMYGRITEGKVLDYRRGSKENTDISGNIMPRTPLLTANATLGQYIDTSIGWFDWIASAQYKSEQYFTVFNGTGKELDAMMNPIPTLNDHAPAYWRLDLGVGYSRPNGKARIEAFVNNVANTTYMTSIITAPGFNYRFINDPRQAGLRAKVLF